jgi:NADPH:quinone reductase-like Zn-dependent oxidoreductase
MQISADVQFPEEKDIDNFVPRPSKDRMELREGHVPASRNNPTHFRTHVDYMDDRDIVQRQYSAFDAVGVDGHRVFPNRALADGNESLASTLPPPHAVQFQHPYAYQPPVQRSITEISCGTNPTPVSPINQQSPPAEKPLVEKSKSFIAMIGASLVPKSCVPIGNLNEAIAAEEEETKMKLKSSLCEYLDPNNDLNDYDSDDSDDNGSPRKRQKNRKYSSFDENSIVDDDRYTRPDSHVRQSPRNLMLQRDFGDGERQFRTRITVHQNGTQNLEVQQHSSQQTIHTTGQRRSNHSSFLPKSVQKRLDNQFAADFQPFEEMELHDALWGSEESPDPIFSSATDPDMMRQQRNSTGRIGVLQETTDLTRRQSGPVLSTKHNSQEFPRSQSATREYLGSGKLEKKKKSDDVGRSKSTGRGTRVEYFLQKLSGQRENQYQSRENELTRKRRSRSLSKEPSRRSNGTTYQDNFETFFGVESAEWSSTENQEKKIPQNNQLKELTKNTPRINARVHNKLDAAWANHEKSASHLKHLDERKSPGSSQRLQQRSFSPSKDQTSQFRLREKISEELPSNRKNQNEDGNGHYMYVAYSRFGDDAQNVLQLCEHQTLPAPNSRHNEVLIRVEACTVSTSDCAIRRGEWPKVSLNPFIIPGTAFVGRVHGGRKAKRWSSHSKFSFTSPIQPGDTVMSLMITGANARYTCVPKSQLIKVPPRINVDKAACLIENYLTAFQVLHMGKKGATRYKEFSLEGRSVLILGGYSAMGRALIELSIAGGAEYCYASASQPHYQMQCGGNVHSIPSFRRQYEALTRWGAIPLSSNPQDWLTLIGGQIDLMVTVYDPSDHALYNEVVTEDHCKALRKDGQVVVICTHPGLNKNEECEDVFDRPSPDSSYYSRQSHNLFRLSALRMKNHHRDKLVEDRTIWYNLFDTWERSKPDRHGNSKNVAKKDLEHLLILLDQDQLHPEVLERIPLSKIGKAQFILEHKRLAGHLVCAPWLNQQTT